MRMHIIMIKNMENEEAQKKISVALENAQMKASVSFSSKSVSIEGNSDDVASVKRILTSLGFETL